MKKKKDNKIQNFFKKARKEGRNIPIIAMKKERETISKQSKHFEEFLKNSKYIGLN